MQSLRCNVLRMDESDWKIEKSQAKDNKKKTAGNTGQVCIWTEKMQRLTANEED